MQKYGFLNCITYVCIYDVNTYTKFKAVNKNIIIQNMNTEFDTKST